MGLIKGIHMQPGQVSCIAGSCSLKLECVAVAVEIHNVLKSFIGYLLAWSLHSFIRTGYYAVYQDPATTIKDMNHSNGHL